MTEEILPDDPTKILNSGNFGVKEINTERFSRHEEQAEDRYQIRSKIGEGGVGAVYRAFDTNLNREVAIKRVLSSENSEGIKEGTEAMLKEATSLCSLQHPNIVTIFDTGVDQDGPYVVMELLSGKTIDEMVKRGVLTLTDFRELALQCQEALIAAQDQNLVHRDIKPSNLMVTWLPSGRFHIKLVDFGLAKFSAKPSHQTIAHDDSVFGSIRFMAPEQFERQPLDQRTDMYAIGCVYYYCLTGTYPFDGESAPQVMASHLQHKVTEISEIRPDLPSWLCNWIMWHISRKIDNRPSDARESLNQFLMNENNPESETPEVPASNVQPEEAVGPVNPATAPQPTQAKRPRLIIPEQEAAQVQPAPVQPAPVQPAPVQPAPVQPAPVQLAPVQLTPPPAPAEPAPVQPTPVQVTPAPAYTEPAPVQPTPVQVTPAPAYTEPAPVQSAPAQPAPVKLTPVTIAPAPQITIPLSVTAQTPPAAAAPLGSTTQPRGIPSQPQPGGVGIGSVAPMKKQGVSNAVKGMIAITLAAGIILAGFIYKGKSDQSAKTERINEIVMAFGDPNNLPTDISLSTSDVQLLLDELVSGGVKDTMARPTYLQALNIGKATDDVDISAQVANYARDVDMTGALRVKLFQVVGARGDESALPALIEFAQKTDDTSAGQGALNAAKQMASASNFESLLTIITNSANASIKNSAVDVLTKVIGASEDPSTYSKAIMGSYNNTADTDAKTALLRLMGSAGGDEASNLVSKTLAADDPKMKVAAIFALRNWPDDSQFDTLYEYASEEQDDRIRSEAFSGLVSFLKAHPELDEDDKAIYWEDVASISTGETEQRMVVDAMVSQKGSWADDVLDYFIESGDTDKVQFRAEKAKLALADRLKRAKRGASSEEKEEDEDEDESDKDEE